MKKLVLTSAIALLGLLTFSCSEIETQNPQTANANLANARSGAATAVNIVISRIETNIIPAKNKDYKVGLDYEASNTIYIYGSGFGTKQGKVSFSNYTKEYFVSYVKSWTDKLVILSASAALSASPRKDVKIFFQDAQGNGQSNAFPPVVPFIFSREYGTATHFCSMKRGLNNLAIQFRGEEYTKLSGSVNATYKPRANDILVWTTTPKHQAYVDKVSAERIVNGDRLFDLTLSEMNETTGKVANPVITIKIRNGVIIDPYKSSLRNTSPQGFYR